jgi:hypothetical protein
VAASSTSAAAVAVIVIITEVPGALHDLACARFAAVIATLRAEMLVWVVMLVVAVAVGRHWRLVGGHVGAPSQLGVHGVRRVVATR